MNFLKEMMDFLNKITKLPKQKKNNGFSLRNDMLFKESRNFFKGIMDFDYKMTLFLKETMDFFKVAMIFIKK